MLNAIDATAGTLVWDCLLYDRAGRRRSCGSRRVAPLERARYLSGATREQQEGSRPREGNAPAGRGAVIALPRCPACGVQTFLKADYSPAELLDCTAAVQNDAGEVWAYVLLPGHARTLRAQWLLYERGLAESAPPLPSAPPAWLSHALLARGGADVAHALWFGFQAVWVSTGGERGPSGFVTPASPVGRPLIGRAGNWLPALWEAVMGSPS